MKHIFTFILAIAFSVLVNAQYLSKVYVLSEGGFSPNSSSLSMLNMQNNTFTQNIFSPGSLGLYPDGIILHSDRLYLTEQGNFGSSGRIYRLDTLGTVQSSAVVGTNPYSLAIANNKIYITNGPASNVSVLNLSNFNLIKNVSVGVYPQEILSFNNKVFVANNSLWGGNSDSTVSVIDANLDSVVHRIIVRKDPSSLAISNDNHLLIGCPGNETNGRIFKVNLDNYQIVDSYTIPTYGFGKDISVDKNSNKIYFISNQNSIISYDLTTRTSQLIVSSVPQTNFYYGYAYDYVNKRHYVLDAKSFTVNGSLLIADSTGTIRNTYQTSIAPRRVLLKYVLPTSNIENNFITKDFQLYQNYPNPFNPVTVISWQSPVSSHQTLKVYDVLGNEITTLVDEYRDAGKYEIEFNSRVDNKQLASGIYYYQLKVGDFIQTKKMILTK